MTFLEDAAKQAAVLDSNDEISDFRDEFEISDPDLIYLDGNSLGRMPKAARAALVDVIDRQWADGLVRSWEDWITLTRRAGDAIGASVLGAPPGSTVVADSTSINLYKLASAAIDSFPERTVIVTDHSDFPTDRYLMGRLASERGGSIRWIRSDPIDGVNLDDLRHVLDDTVALVCLSHVNYLSGAIADMADITTAAHACGAMILWDVSHSVGSVPIDVMATRADFVTGCTYKYLNSGPGAPAFLYVRPDLIHGLAAPLPGWFAQKDQFDMGPVFEAAPGIDRFQVGTPPILSATPILISAEMYQRAGIERVRAKSVALTEFLIEIADETLSPLGFGVGTPRDPRRRGGHVTLTHEHALDISVALRLHKNVVGDFRMPDGIRLAPAPLYTRFADIVEAATRIAEVVESGLHRTIDVDPRVT